MNMFKLVVLVMPFVMNSLAFAQDTTLTVTSDGNVGIGTTSPSHKLDVGTVGENIPTAFFGVFQHAVGAADAGPQAGPQSDPNRVAYLAAATQSGIYGLNAFDYTTGSGLPITIGWSGSHDIYLARVGGNVGIGTASPQTKLQINVADTGSDDGIIIRNSETGTDQVHLRHSVTGNGAYLFLFDDAGTNKVQLRSWGNSIFNGGNVGIGTTSPSHPLEMGSGAHVTASGVWTDASSRALKENIRDLTGDEATRALSQLAPKRYNYKAEKGEEYLGFIAEDVPELVATGNRKSLSPMDIVAVLTKVVQEQQKKIAELEARINSDR